MVEVWEKLRIRQEKISHLHLMQTSCLISEIGNPRTITMRCTEVTEV